MKTKYFILVLLIFVLSSCGGLRWQIGETTESFMQRNHKRSFDIVRSSNEWTVYKWVNNWSYTDPPYFFYFHNGTLFQVDRGQRPPDFIIQNQ